MGCDHIRSIQMMGPQIPLDLVIIRQSSGTTAQRHTYLPKFCPECGVDFKGSDKNPDLRKCKHGIDLSDNHSYCQDCYVEKYGPKDPDKPLEKPQR